MGRHFDPYRAIAQDTLTWDPDRLLEGFETPSIAARRDEKLVRALQMAGRHDLAEDLLPAIERDEPAPAWSNSAYVPLRRWSTNEAVSLAITAKEETGHLGVVASIIAASLTAPIGGLSAIPARNAVKLIWDGLDHVDLAGCRVIGGVDVSFNEAAGANQAPGYFQVHAVVAVLGYDPSNEARDRFHQSIRAAFDLEPTAPIPVQVKVLRDPVEQLSYLMKRMFVRRVSIIDNRGRKNTLSRPLKPAQEAEIAAWLSGFPQTDRLILKGLRRQGDRIVPTSPRRKHAGRGE